MIIHTPPARDILHAATGRPASAVRYFRCCRFQALKDTLYLLLIWLLLLYFYPNIADWRMKAAARGADF